LAAHTPSENPLTPLRPFQLLFPECRTARLNEAHWISAPFRATIAW